jgi:hypothetical protein
MSAGFLLLEDAHIGPGAYGVCAELLIALRNEAPDLNPVTIQGALERRLRAGQRLAGCGVPLRPECERLLLMKESIARRGRDQLPYWRLLECTVGALHSLKAPEPSVGLGVAAALLDLGFTPRQIANLCVALAQPVFLATAIEGSEQKERVLRRLPDDRVRYVGAAPRLTPRAAKATGEGEASKRE